MKTKNNKSLIIKLLLNNSVLILETLPHINYVYIMTLKKDFRYNIKQNGGMLAKGRLLGIQFLTLFEDGLYSELSRHAISQAMRIRDAFKAAGYAFLVDSPSNQQFPILDNKTLEKLSENFRFSIWKKIDDTNTAVRFCTSWATRPEAVDALIEAIQ